MLLLSMKIYLSLLWGISALFSKESVGASIPETSNLYPTAVMTTKQPNSADVVYNGTEAQPETWKPTYKPAEVSEGTAAETTVPPTAISHRSELSNGNVTGSVTRNAEATAAGSSGPQLLHTLTAVTTRGAEAQTSPNMMITETTKPTRDLFNHPTPTTLTGLTSSSAVSWLQPTSPAEPEVTSNASFAPADPTQFPHPIQNLSSPSTSATFTVRGTPTSEAAPASDPTSLHVTTSETSTNNTELSSTSQPISVTTAPFSTSKLIDTGGLSSTTEPISFSTGSANTITAAVSTSPAGIFIHRVTKRLPFLTTESTPATTKASKSPPSTEAQTCSTRGVVKHCLIALTSLAGLATIFMVSTIILCTRLSARKYKVKKPQQATEMMCISALLPDRSYTYTRQHNPVANGVLVIHSSGDSNEDGGDNLTLSSFLPENDHYV